MWETWVWSLGWEDPLEKGKATHSSILAWRIPRTIQSIGSQRVGRDWMTFIHFDKFWNQNQSILWEFLIMKGHSRQGEEHVQRWSIYSMCMQANCFVHWEITGIILIVLKYQWDGWDSQVYNCLGLEFSLLGADTEIKHKGRRPRRGWYSIQQENT